MGLFGSTSSSSSSTDEAKKIEKVLAKESKTDEKALSSALKHLQAAEKGEAKVAKAAQHAQEVAEKALKTEHQKAKKLNDAEYQHNVALQNQKKAEHDVQLSKQHLERMHAETEARRAELDQAQDRKSTGDIQRNNTLSKATQRRSIESQNGEDAAAAATTANGTPPPQSKSVDYGNTQPGVRLTDQQNTVDSPATMNHPTNGVA